MAKLKANIKDLKIPFKNYLFIALAVAVTTLLLVILFQGKLPPQVPLLYGAAEGEGQLISSWGLVIPSAFSILIIVVNSILASFMADDFTKKTLVIMALVVTLFAIVTTLKIFFLVGSF